MRVVFHQGSHEDGLSTGVTWSFIRGHMRVVFHQGSHESDLSAGVM